MQRNCTHATKAPNRSPACPWARPRSCNCAPPLPSTSPAVLAKKEIASTQRNCAHATNPPKPLPSTSPGKNPAPTVPRAVPQHVSSYDIQWKRSPPRANTEPHPRNEIAPMQRKHLTAPQHVPGHVPGHATVPLRSPARPRRDRPQPFPALCCSTCAATISYGNVPRRVLIRNRIHATKLHPCNEST